MRTDTGQVSGDNEACLLFEIVAGRFANRPYDDLIQAQDAAGMLNFTYDSIGRIVSFKNQDNKTGDGSIIGACDAGPHVVK